MEQENKETPEVVITGEQKPTTEEPKKEDKKSKKKEKDVIPDIKLPERPEVMKKMEEFEKTLKEVGVEHSNNPKIPSRVKPVASYGGRIRVEALVAEDATKWIGQIVNVAGWARTLKEQGKGSFAFIKLNDGSTIKAVQCVIQNNMPGYDHLVKQGLGVSVSLKGLIIKSPGKEQPIELQVSDAELHQVKVLGECNPSDYPFSKNTMKLESLREIAHLRPRTNLIACTARVRNALSFATHSFFNGKGFNYVHTPIVTGSDCEGAGEMFQVTTLLPKKDQPPKLELTDKGTIDYKKDFFGKETYLTVSGQLAVENYACTLSDVYTFGPTFRAENSNTVRHLAEFWMIEPEMCFADIFDDMELAENYLKYCVRYVLEHNLDDLEFLEKNNEKEKVLKQDKDDKTLIERLRNIVDNEFAKISYTQAIELLEEKLKKSKNLFKEKVFWGVDLATEHERYIAEKIFQKPVIVYNYPKDIKAFYMRQNDDGKTVAAMDMLIPRIGELIGGSQREERLDVLKNRLAELKMDEKDYWWYLDLRKFGSVPHSGFGLGFERLVMLCTGMANIRDVIPYPRYPGHSEF